MDMKKFWILLIILISVIVISFVIIILKRKKVEPISNDIKYMCFSYSKGYMINSNIIYEINEKDGKFIAKIKPYGIADEDAKYIEIDNNTLEKIIDVLNKYNVSSWNGFHESDRNVLDGDSFSFSLKTTDNDISASGYMRWPTNYRNVRDELDSIFEFTLE